MRAAHHKSLRLNNNTTKDYKILLEGGNVRSLDVSAGWVLSSLADKISNFN